MVDLSEDTIAVSEDTIAVTLSMKDEFGSVLNSPARVRAGSKVTFICSFPQLPLDGPEGYAYIASLHTLDNTTSKWFNEVCIPKLISELLKLFQPSYNIYKIYTCIV